MSSVSDQPFNYASALAGIDAPSEGAVNASGSRAIAWPLFNVNHVREVGRTPRGDFIFVLAGGATLTSSEGFRDVMRQYLAQFRVGSAEAVR